MEFSEMYNTFYPPMKRFIAGMVADEWAAEDLSQETFLTVKEKVNGLRDDSKLKAWVFRIARNRCLDYFRSQAIQKVKGEARDHIEEAIELAARVGLEQHEMSRCVQDRILQVPEPLRAALVLFDTMEMSHREIADILEISVGNVKVRLHRARKALKAILERDCDFEHDERNVMVCLPKALTHIRC